MTYSTQQRTLTWQHFLRDGLLALARKWCEHRRHTEADRIIRGLSDHMLRDVGIDPLCIPGRYAERCKIYPINSVRKPPKDRNNV